MYTDVQIQAYNDHRSSYDAIWAAVKRVRTQQIGFGASVISDGTDRCAIHVPVFLDDTGSGCGDVGIGDHPSIKSLYDEDGHVVCHAEEGSRVIDSELAGKIAVLDDAFVRLALSCGKRFSKRYMSGADVGWKRYGRGYCYLQLLHQNVRHRVARILGPFPLVSDVVRFMAAFGCWSSTGFRLQRLPGDVIHVVGCDWSPQHSMRNTIMQLSHRRDLRIGGSYLSVVSNGLNGYADVFGLAGYRSNLPAVGDVKGFLAVVPKKRVNDMIEWMTRHGVVVSDDVVACLLIATSAMIALNVPGSHDMRFKVRMWQVFGDIVCKNFAAMHVLTSGGTVEDYSHLVGKDKQCNKAMSAAIVESDLFPVCDARNLSVTSKAWADILEGVIGVVAMTQSTPVLKHCLTHFHMIPSDVVGSETSIGKLVDLPQLNSGEWRRAAEIVVRGKL